jgi:integrase
MVSNSNRGANAMNIKYLTPAEVKSVLQVAQRHSARAHAIVLLGYTHGLRVSEIAALTLADIANGRIRVNRAKGSLATDQLLQHSKDPLRDEQIVLNVWLAERGDNPSQYVFTGRQASSRKGSIAGKPVSTRQIENLFEQLATEAGLPVDKRHPHILKHSICANMARAKQGIENIALWVGHKDLNNTRVYLNLTQDEVAASIGSALESVFDNLAAA